ncbi:MAG: hypothetical protein QMD11_03730 [Smithella sp.]|nr:hypothetical protein [Smithella sp.]
MIYYLTLPVLSILLIAMQSIITDIIFSNRFVFEISLMAVIYAGFRLDLIRGVVLAFIIGLMFDYIGGVLPGLSAFVYMIFCLGMAGYGKNTRHRAFRFFMRFGKRTCPDDAVLSDL